MSSDSRTPNRLCGGRIGFEFSGRHRLSNEQMNPVSSRGRCRLHGKVRRPLKDPTRNEGCRQLSLREVRTGLCGARFEIQETALVREETAGWTPNRSSVMTPSPTLPSVDKIAPIRAKVTVTRKRLGCSGLRGGGCSHLSTVSRLKFPVPWEKTGKFGEKQPFPAKFVSTT